MVTHTLVESFSESRLSDPVGKRGRSESTLRGDGGGGGGGVGEEI